MARIWAERATSEIPHPKTVGTAVVGTSVGVPVTGAAEGEAEIATVGVPVTGATEGEVERATVGTAVIAIGNSALVGFIVGKSVGLFEGAPLGPGLLEGASLGLREGASLGLLESAPLGLLEGTPLG